jgi:hypothetical protein
MEFSIGERVRVRGQCGRIVARVRGDDDPRKCVPAGERFVSKRGDVAPRQAISYLVRVDGRATLVWSWPHAVEPELPALCGVGQNAPRGAYRSSSVCDAAKAISHGTMAYMTGVTQSAALDRIRTRFIQHIIGTESCGTVYANWIEAWGWFVNGQACNDMPSYVGVDRLYVVVRRRMDGSAQAAERFSMVDGSLAVVEEAGVGPLDLQVRRSASMTDTFLMRVGFVARHWFVARQRESFEAWAHQCEEVGCSDALRGAA